MEESFAAGQRAGRSQSANIPFLEDQPGRGDGLPWLQNCLAVPCTGKIERFVEVSRISRNAS